MTDAGRDLFYRKWSGNHHRMRSFEVKEGETDLLILCDLALEKEARKAVRRAREEISAYIRSHPRFAGALRPVKQDRSAPPLIRMMTQAAEKSGVGPMAGIAGIIAEFTGRSLLKSASQVIVENGGDIFVCTKKRRMMSVYAGESPLSGKIEVVIRPGAYGICTSSGTVGHSLSYGRADAATVICEETVLADCVATQTANLVKDPEDLTGAIEYAKNINGVKAVLIIAGKRLATWGDIELA